MATLEWINSSVLYLSNSLVFTPYNILPEQLGWNIEDLASTAFSIIVEVVNAPTAGLYKVFSRIFSGFLMISSPVLAPRATLALNHFTAWVEPRNRENLERHVTTLGL